MRLRDFFEPSALALPLKTTDFFLVVAPPIEVSNQYLPILGKIAAFAKDPDVPERLSRLSGPEEFFRLLEEKGV